MYLTIISPLFLLATLSCAQPTELPQHIPWCFRVPEGQCTLSFVGNFTADATETNWLNLRGFDEHCREQEDDLVRVWGERPAQYNVPLKEHEIVIGRLEGPYENPPIDISFVWAGSNYSSLPTTKRPINYMCKSDVWDGDDGGTYSGFFSRCNYGFECV